MFPHQPPLLTPSNCCTPLSPTEPQHTFYIFVGAVMSNKIFDKGNIRCSSNNNVHFSLFSGYLIIFWVQRPLLHCCLELGLLVFVWLQVPVTSICITKILSQKQLTTSMLLEQPIWGDSLYTIGQPLYY